MLQGLLSGESSFESVNNLKQLEPSNALYELFFFPMDVTQLLEPYSS